MRALACEIEFTLRNHAFQTSAEAGKRPCSVAELMFDERAQLAEGLVIFGDEEEGVVPESAWATGLAGQSSAAGAFGFVTALAGKCLSVNSMSSLVVSNRSATLATPTAGAAT